MRPERARRGVVLLAALVVLGVVGTLLTAGYFVERERWAVRLAAGRSAQLRAAAEAAAADALAQWDSAARFRQPPGSTEALPGPWSASESRLSGRVTRLSTWSYHVALRATDLRDDSLSARSASVMYVDAPRFSSSGALIAGGDVRVSGSLTWQPVDSAAAVECEAPEGWSGGIVTAPGRAAPAGAAVDPGAADDSTYTAFGGVTRAVLATRADVSLPAGSVIEAPEGNVTHAMGNLELTGGAGSGLLLVDGALRVSGSVTFRGVIVVAGGFTVVAGTFALAGQLRSAAAATAVDVNTTGAMRLRYDPCAIRDVEWHAGRAQFADSGPATPSP